MADSVLTVVGNPKANNHSGLNPALILLTLKRLFKETISANKIPGCPACYISAIF